MDTRILDTLHHATSFDLYELSVAIDRILTDPVRILDIRKRLHVGQQVQFFSVRHASPVAGRIVELRPKQVVIEEVETRQRWLLQYPAIAVDSAAQAPAAPTSSPKIDRNSFAVGDTVGFTDKHLRQRVGTILRLNDKTASIDCGGESWRVSWRILRKISTSENLARQDGLWGRILAIRNSADHRFHLRRRMRQGCNCQQSEDCE